MNYDKLLCDLFFIDDWHLNKSNLEKYKSHYKKKDKYKNIIEYLENRYSDSLSFKETIYRIKHKIEIRPTCKECGNKVEFIGKYPILFRSFCSNKCSANNKETIKKKYESDLKNHNGKIGWIESNKSKQKIQNRKNTLIKKYNSLENANRIIYNKVKKSFMKKYGTVNIMSLDWVKEKKNFTYKINNSFNKSNPEEICYNLLKEKYNDTIRQYRSKEYPFNCDFYIPSLDLYIEFNGSQYHHGHPFNENDKNDINELNKLKKLEIEKLKENIKTQYTQIIYTWTDLDVRKRKTAKANNLNYLEFYNIKELEEWLQKN